MDWSSGLPRKFLNFYFFEFIANPEAEYETDEPTGRKSGFGTYILTSKLVRLCLLAKSMLYSHVFHNDRGYEQQSIQVTCFTGIQLRINFETIIGLGFANNAQDLNSADNKKPAEIISGFKYQAEIICL